MPIIIPRNGEIIPPDSGYSQEQSNTAWEHIVRAWLDKHPEALEIDLETDAPEV